MPATNRSASPSSSRSSSPPLQLDPSTLAALSSFYDEQAEAERQFAELEKKAHDRLVQAQEGRADGGTILLLLETDEEVWWAKIGLRRWVHWPSRSKKYYSPVRPCGCRSKTYADLILVFQ